jgi:hypothetical protein
MDRQYNDKWGAVNRRDGQTIQWQMRSSKSERWTDNTMTNEEYAPHLSLYCLFISLIYCSSFVIVLSVHLSDLLLLICHCIVCPSLRFTAPHLPLYCLSISPIYCSSYNGKWGAINRRDEQTIQWLMRSSKSERWTNNTMTNEEQ